MNVRRATISEVQPSRTARWTTPLAHPQYSIERCPACGFPEADGGWCPECGLTACTLGCPCRKSKAA